MDPFIAYLLIKQIEKDNKIALDQSQKNTVKNTVKKEQQKNNCSRCGQNYYWCQCLAVDNY